MSKKTRRKGMSMLGIVFLALILFVCLTTLFAFWFISSKGLLESKQTIYISMQLDDSGSELASLLKTSSDGKSFMKIIGESFARKSDEKSLEKINAAASKIGPGYEISIDGIVEPEKKTQGTCIYEVSETLSKNLINPMPNNQVVVSNPGWRLDPVEKDPNKKKCKCHAGVDISGENIQVKAAYSGIVKYSDDAGDGYGKKIIIEHDSSWTGYKTYYTHLNQILVGQGEYVRQGVLLGLSGSTGRVTGPHLHFELRKGDNPINPCKYLSDPPDRCFVDDRCHGEYGDEKHYISIIPLPGARADNLVKKVELIK